MFSVLTLSMNNGIPEKKPQIQVFLYSLLILNAAQVTLCFEISGSNSLQSQIQARAATVQNVHMFGEQLVANS